MGPPGRVARGSVANNFARASSTLGEMGTEAQPISRFQVPSEGVHAAGAPPTREQCDSSAKDAATLPLALGGLGLRSAVHTSVSAYWASWADSFAMIHQRHPEVADRIVVALDGVNHTPALSAARSAGRPLIGVEGFDPPSWRALSLGVRPAMREPDDFELGTARHGWQHEASSRVEREHCERRIMPRLADSEKAMLRSQSGPGAGLALSATPSNSCWIAPHLFRVLLLRRLRLPLPLVSRTCRCGRQPTRLATIAQRAPELECWGGGVLLSRAMPPECAEKVAPGYERFGLEGA